MATTQETYRLGTRYPRYTTKLNAFNAGMYLTNQVEPEGYVKRMVNYDIDATGSHIRPRKGRKVVQDIDPIQLRTNYSLGLPILTDYLYNYDAGVIDNVTDDTVPALVKPYNVTNVSDVLLDDMGNGYLYDSVNSNFEIIVNRDLSPTKIKSYFYDDSPLVFDKTMFHSYSNYLHTVTSNELYAIKEDGETGTLGIQKIILGNFWDSSKEQISYFTKTEPLELKRLNPTEGANTGFNMLLEKPYIFEDEPGGTLNITGVVKYDADDTVYEIPKLTAELGEELKLRVYYQYEKNKTITYKVEMLNLDSLEGTYTTLMKDKTLTAGSPWVFNFTPKFANTQLKITAQNKDETASENVFYLAIYCNVNALKEYELRKINLLDCKGMISWFSYTGVYGVKEAPDTIFFSDIENPGYFPFPNNAIKFDNVILAVHNYLDYLLVITVDSIYLVSIGTSIMTSIQKKVMSNIFIPELDAVNLVVLKDQIFFKDATQFYVLKPNNYTSDATDLKNYVISTAIDNYTKNFTVETVKLLNEVYRTTCQRLTAQYKHEVCIEDFDLLRLRSDIMDEEVHYIYTIRPIYSNDEQVLKIGKYEITSTNIDLHLIYNTLTRAWRIYLKPLGDNNYNTEDSSIMGALNSDLLWRNKSTGEYYEFFFVHDANKYSEEDAKFAYNMTYNTIKVIKITDESSTDNFTYVTGDEIVKLSEHYDNYNYIDTGIIAIEDVFTKRWREVQFNILNSEPTMIPFYSSFILDGVERVHSTHYQLQHITDPEDPEYGKIYITPSEIDNLEVGNVLLHGTSTLAGEATDTDYWALDLSQFPELTMVTVRFSLQGRGRHASLKLLNTSLKRYELADINWVYRMMSAR